MRPVYRVYNAPTPPEPVEIEVYEPNPEKPGCLRHVRNRTIQEIYDELVKRLKKDRLYPDEYFEIVGCSCCSSWGEREFPRFRTIACYPVTGASEGHYIHVDALVFREDIRSRLLECVPIFLGKTFQGFEFAAQVAAACAKHLGI